MNGRFPQPPKLPMGMQSPLCERCVAAGRPMEVMEVIVSRSFNDEFGTLTHHCGRCGHTTTPTPVPLYVLAASNLDQLGQILAVRDIAEVEGIAGLSPGAQQLVEQYSMNPYLLAEAAAAFAVQWQLAKDDVARLSERLSDAANGE